MYHHTHLNQCHNRSKRLYPIRSPSTGLRKAATGNGDSQQSEKLLKLGTFNLKYLPECTFIPICLRHSVVGEW